MLDDLKRILGIKPRSAASLVIDLPPAAGYGDLVAIVGESYRVEALTQLSGRRGLGAIDSMKQYEALLVPEPDNPVDSNAVRIEIGHRHVGYLSRADALAYRPLTLELIRTRQTGRCSAQMFCREGKPNIGVWLDLGAPAKCRLRGRSA